MERPNKKYNIDRLSSLPDALLCHILSFLPTKFSVATSVLAKRYKSLWTDVPNLEFLIWNHRNESVNIINVINRVLLLSNVRELNSFRLTMNDDENFEDEDLLLDTWIRITIARNVQTLDIRLGNQLCLPRCLFTCETLVDLRLHRCGSLPDSRIFLPNLKKLHLYRFQYGSGGRFRNLISGCPVLEELDMQYILFRDLDSCIISSPTIKRLTLNLDCWVELDGDDSDSEDDINDLIWNYEVEINAPAVTYLVVRGLPSQYFSNAVLNSLTEANICLSNFGVHDDAAYCNSVLDLVDKVYLVRSLTLSIPHYQFGGGSFADVTRKFINLTKLELTANWRFLFNFLGNADNLQILIIGAEINDNVEIWKKPQQVPICLSTHLRQVTIKRFAYLKVEFEAVRYFLRHGKVLNMIDIICPEWETMKYSILEKKFKALQRISAFERRSETCKIQFS